MQDLLDYDSEDVADVFCLSFSVSLNVFGEITARDLIPNGSNITVTHDNKYVQSLQWSIIGPDYAVMLSKKVSSGPLLPVTIAHENNI